MTSHPFLPIKASNSSSGPEPVSTRHDNGLDKSAKAGTISQEEARELARLILFCYKRWKKQ
jgi:hypothetical protein